jgi:hypothetical protein
MHLPLYVLAGLTFCVGAVLFWEGQGAEAYMLLLISAVLFSGGAIVGAIYSLDTVSREKRLKRLARLKTKGLIDDHEYEQWRKHVLAES